MPPEDRRSRLIVIVSTVHGEGHGAEAVLEHLLRAWDVGDLPLLMLAPPDSIAGIVAREKKMKFVPLLSRRDCAYQNVIAATRAIPRLAGCLLAHAWHARGFELGRWIGRRLRIPVTGTLHDHPHASFHGYWRRRLMKWASSGFCRLACVSQAVADACDACGYSCPREVIRNGLANAPVRSSRGSGPVHIGFLGMYAEWKGLSVVQEWVAQCADLGVHWHLYGTVAPSLRDRAEIVQRSAPGQVHLDGHRSTADIFDGIDILVAPSIQFDPLPTVLIEAARAGIPCVASDCGGAPEIVEHLKTGFLFAAAEPATGLPGLRRLVADKDLRMAMGSAARRKFEGSFGVSRMVSAYADFWRERVAEEGGATCR